MANSKSTTTKGTENATLTLIRARLPADQRPILDALPEDDKEFLVGWADESSRGADEVVERWEYLLAQMECYRDF